MTIDANTKIARIIRENDAALEAIISITPKFEKLRNPLLRKLMAGRTSIGMAAKISGCSLEDFFETLAPLGFRANRQISQDNPEEKRHVPGFLHLLKPGQITELDVRPIIGSGKDPLALISKSAAAIQPGSALKIINTFEPTPLLNLLGRQGFESFVDDLEENLVETYFYRPINNTAVLSRPEEPGSDGWDDLLKKYEDRMVVTDVRHLPMPQPMHMILQALDHLEDKKALFVHHKKIPVFLLPELKEMGFEYRIRELDEMNVQLIIFKEE